MIALNEIKRALTKLLSGLKGGINIFTEDIEQMDGMELAFPLLHIQLVPLGHELQLNSTRIEREILFDITFMEKRKSNNEAMYEMFEEIAKALGDGFLVGNRFLKVFSVNASVADDLLHTTFQVRFMDTLQEENPGEPLETLEM